MKRSDNYFIGIILPRELEDTIERSREWMRRECGCRSGMRTQPHITLIPPFGSSLSLSEMKSLLSPIAFKSFDVSVSGYGSFAERTIFARVEGNSELEKLKMDLSGHLRDCGVKTKDEKFFTPHITIANRDIRPEAFIPSMEHFGASNLRYSFTVDSIMVFEFRDYFWHSCDTNSVRFFS